MPIDKNFRDFGETTKKSLDEFVHDILNNIKLDSQYTTTEGVMKRFHEKLVLYKEEEKLTENQIKYIIDKFCIELENSGPEYLRLAKRVKERYKSNLN